MKPVDNKRFVITRGEAVWCEERQRYVTSNVTGYEYDGPWALASVRNPTWVAEDYRFYYDTGNAGSSAIAAQNTAVKVSEGFKFRLRVAVGETNNANTANVGSWVLQAIRNGGTPFTVTTSSNYVKAVTSDAAEFVDGNTLTQALGGVTGSAAYQSTWSAQDENGAVASQTWTDDDTEYEYALQLSGCSISDTITFRMLSPSSSTAITFTNVPTITVSATLAVDSASPLFTGSTDLALNATYSLAVDKGDLVLAGQDFGTSISYAHGSLAFVGQDVQFILPTNFTLPIDGAVTTFAFVGQTVAIGAGDTVDEGALTFAGQDLAIGYGLPIDVGSLAFAGATDIVYDRGVPVVKGDLVLAGQAVTLGRNYTLAVDSGSIAFAGQDFGGAISLGAGSLAFAPQEIILIADEGYTITVEEGALTLSGQDVTLLAPRIYVDAASLTFSGADFGTSVAFGHGAIAFVGQEVDFIRLGMIDVVSSPLTFTGQDVVLSGAEGTGYIIVDSANLTFSPGADLVLEEAQNVDEAILTFTGTADAFGINVGTVVVEQAIQFTGQEITLSYTVSQSVTVDTSNLLFAGQDVVLVEGEAYTLFVEAGSLTFTPSNLIFDIAAEPVHDDQFLFQGQPMGLYHQITFPFDSGNIAFTGQAIGSVQEGTFVLTVTQANLALSGQNVNFTLGTPDTEFTVDGQSPHIINTQYGSTMMYCRNKRYYIIPLK